jgi:pimeloyl-ACP methyl ester carboxylesterase
MTIPLTAPPRGIAPSDGQAALAVERPSWMDIDWRTHQRWVVVDGQPVNTIELGTGRPLLFIHGLGGCWANWLEQLSPVANHPAAEVGHDGPPFAGEEAPAPRRRRDGPRPAPAIDGRLVAVDLPGFGHSPMSAGPISIAGYARLLDRLLAQLEIDSATVLGNSMGGLIGAELALAFPRRVERLVLISPAGVSTFGHLERARGRLALRGLEPTLAATTAWAAANAERIARRPRLRRASLKFVVRHPGRLPPALAAEQLRGGGKPGFMSALESTDHDDLRSRLGEIACPTLIVWGDGDRVISVRDADVFSALIPHSRGVIFADTGHMAMLERPLQFNALLEDFLSG